MQTIEIKAVYIRERMRFDGSSTIVGEIRLIESPEVGFAFGDLPCTILGDAEPEELQPFGSYLFFGTWRKYRHPRTGRQENQFKFVSFVESQPLDRDSVKTYLITKGRGCGIGPARANMLVEKFGANAVTVAREQPEVLVAALKGAVDIEQANQLAAVLEIDKHREHCHIELMALLKGRGLPKKTADHAMKAWGNKASQVIKSDPYKLMAFKGCGFKRCDQMYIALGLDQTKLKRQALCAWYSIASDTSGDTWFPVEKCVHAVTSNIGTIADPRKAILLAKRAKMIDAKRDSQGKIWVADYKKANHEKRIVDYLREAASDYTPWMEPGQEFDSRLSDHQREQLAGVFTDGRLPAVWILGGSPGTGKTFSAASFIRGLGATHGWDNIAVAAPTGKAAVRITEAMRDNEIPLKAKTIHSLLRVENADDGSGLWGFVHGETCPLPYKFIICDESSMIDSSLMAALLAARGNGTGIAFIGDVNQLAPVGHGAPLRDMIRAGVPYAELKEIQRNSGRIVQSCSQIRDGKPFGFSRQMEIATGENLGLVTALSPEGQVDAIMRILDNATRRGFDRVWDVQILVAVNKKSQVSRQQLNKILQGHLNTNRPVDGCPFRVGDKIVNTKNKFFKMVEADESSGDLQTNDAGEVYVANGELARVIEIEGQTITARLSNPDRVIKIFRGKSNEESDNDAESETSNTGCTFDLGYALSVHKYQGSEVPIAVVILDEYPGAKLVQTREWIYTAISRAKKLCVCVGKSETAAAMVRKQALWSRKTFLAEDLKEALKLEVVG